MELDNSRGLELMGSWNNSAKGDGTAAVNGAVGWTFYLTKISVRLPLTPMLKWWISNWMCKSEIHKGEQGQIRYFRICSLQMVLVWDNLQRMVDRNSNWAKSSALGHFYIYSIKCKPSSQIFRVRHSQKHVYCFSLNHFLKKEITILQLSQNIQKELEGYFSFFIEQRQKKKQQPRVDKWFDLQIKWTTALPYFIKDIFSTNYAPQNRTLENFLKQNTGSLGSWYKP